MRTLFVASCILHCMFWSTLVSAQLDIKINAHGLIFDQRADVSMEFKLGKKVTIEPSIGLSWRPITISDFNFSSFTITSYNYGELRPALFLKIYPIDRFEYHGFHFGVYLDSEIELYRDDQYDVDYLNQLGFSPSRRTFRKLGLGTFVAYKWVLWGNWVVQPTVGLVNLDVYTLIKDQVFDTSSHVRLMLGYQF